MSIDMSKIQPRPVGFVEGPYSVFLEKVGQDTTTNGNPRVKAQFRLRGNPRFDNRVLFNDLVVTEKTLGAIKARFEELTGQELDGKFASLKAIATFLAGELANVVGTDYTVRLREDDGNLVVVGEFKTA